MKNTLCIIPGVHEQWYCLYADDELVSTIHYRAASERLERSYFTAHVPEAWSTVESKIRTADVMQQLRTLTDGRMPDLVAIALRAPGSAHRVHALVDDAKLSALRKSLHLSPLHIGGFLEECRIAQEIFPKVPVVAVSDTAFFNHIPDAFQSYAIHPKMADQFDIRRFGAGGIAAESALMEVQRSGLSIASRVVQVHWSSAEQVFVTALHEGRPVYSSAGFSSLEGIASATTVGAMDIAAATSLLEEAFPDCTSLLRYMSAESGMKAVIHSSFRDSLDAMMLQGDPRAHDWLRMQHDQISAHMAAAIVRLRGIDEWWFTAEGMLPDAARVDSLKQMMEVLAVKPEERIFMVQLSRAIQRHALEWQSANR